MSAIDDKAIKFYVVNNLLQCETWQELYELIKNDPDIFNVHFCIAFCKKSFHCKEFILKLLQNELLDTKEKSYHYDNINAYGFYISEKAPGERTWKDYFQEFLNRQLNTPWRRGPQQKLVELYNDILSADLEHRASRRRRIN